MGTFRGRAVHTIFAHGAGHDVAIRTREARSPNGTGRLLAGWRTIRPVPIGAGAPVMWDGHKPSAGGRRHTDNAHRRRNGDWGQLGAEEAPVFHSEGPTRGHWASPTLGMRSHVPGHQPYDQVALGVVLRTRFLAGRYSQESPKTFSRRGSDCGQQVAHSCYHDSLTQKIRRQRTCFDLLPALKDGEEVNGRPAASSPGHEPILISQPRFRLTISFLIRSYAISGYRFFHPPSPFSEASHLPGRVVYKP